MPSRSYSATIYGSGEKGSCTVTLPRSFVKRNGLKRGGKVHFVQEDDETDSALILFNVDEKILNEGLTKLLLEKARGNKK